MFKQKDDFFSAFTAFSFTGLKKTNSTHKNEWLDVDE